MRSQLRLSAADLKQSVNVTSLSLNGRVQLCHQMQCRAILVSHYKNVLIVCYFLMFFCCYIIPIVLFFLYSSLSFSSYSNMKPIIISTKRLCCVFFTFLASFDVLQYVQSEAGLTSHQHLMLHQRDRSSSLFPRTLCAVPVSQLRSHRQILLSFSPASLLLLPLPPPPSDLILFLWLTCSIYGCVSKSLLWWNSIIILFNQRQCSSTKIVGLGVMYLLFPFIFLSNFFSINR